MYADHHLHGTPLIRIIDRDEQCQRKITDALLQLGFRVATYESAQHFWAMDSLTEPGCIVAEWLMPDMEGMEFLQHLNHRQCSIPVVFYGEHLRVHSVVEGMRMGAVSFVEKVETIQRLISEITLALMRPSQYSHCHSQDKERWELLTPTEQHIAELISLGLSYQAIGERLGGRSSKTIQNHASSISTKLGVKGRHGITRTVQWLRQLNAQ